MKARKRNLVTCETCQHFRRDEYGPSFNIETGVYFMGVCVIACDPDNTRNKTTRIAKVFASRRHECERFLPNNSDNEPQPTLQLTTQ